MLGYCLKEKTWRTFDINRIVDIEFNPTPFESLVLPEGYKDLMLSFVESQIKDGDTFDDVINGKGGGLVILLAGDPGVGKTLSAESIAEKIQAPLFKMELGQINDVEDDDDHYDDRRRSRAARDAEDHILNAFELAAKWKAVLLIDECDLYLEKRSDASPKRNRLVSRFLQELEYYPSLLFLTTNREKVLDPAIYSRIHLTINYPALDAPSRRKIWNTFLEHDGGAEISESERELLAQINVNGRKIRNLVKTARIMARRRGEPVGFDDVRKVMRITEGLTIG
jgi:SpoVK/Ycf46/Vps4 family AAA+-type ATPase